MLKEKSVASVVSTHIITTAIVMPFFGLLAGYFINKFLGESLSQMLLALLKDSVYIGFFFLGVFYSLTYLKKKIVVKSPQKSGTYSIVIFGIIILFMLIIDILAQPNIASITYNTIFFTLIFALFFIPTKRYFSSLRKTSVSQK